VVPVLSCFGSHHLSEFLLSDEPVAFESRLEYAACIERQRALECLPQVSALRRGFCTLVPDSVLQLLTASQFELLLCGRATVDLDMLQRHTEYSKPYHANHPAVLRLWRVLQSFSQPQLRQFLRFAYAQDNLPASDAEFDAHPRTRLLIKPVAPSFQGQKPDHQMPHAGTEFSKFSHHGLQPSLVTLDPMALDSSSASA
jgi:hypothetical protein